MCVSRKLLGGAVAKGKDSARECSLGYEVAQFLHNIWAFIHHHVTGTSSTFYSTLCTPLQGDAKMCQYILPVTSPNADLVYFV